MGPEYLNQQGSQGIDGLLKGPHFEKPELSQGEQLSSQGGTVLSSTHHPLHSLLSSCLHHHAKYFHSHYSLVLEGIEIVT